MNRIAHYLFVALLIAAVGCKQQPKQAKELNPAFTSYIEGFTAGQISTKSTLRLRLAEPTTVEINNEQKLNKDWFQISPQVAGDLFWLDNHTLEFRPSEDLKSGTAYEVKFALDAVVEDVPAELQTFSYTFKTLEQHADLTINGLKPYSLKDSKWQYLTGKIVTRDAANTEIVHQLLEAEQEGEELSVKWTHSSNNKIHSFHIDSISRKDTSSEVQLNWDGKLIGASQKGEEKYSVPSLSDFSVQSVRAIDQPEQKIVVLFSDPLEEKQLLYGLVSISSRGAFTTSVEGNELHIFPSSRIANNAQLTCYKGISNSYGYKLKQNSTFDISFVQTPPLVRLPQQNGTILPSTDGIVFPFEAVNLNAVDVIVKEIFPSSVPQFMQVNELNGDYQMKRVARVIKKQKVDLNNTNGTDLGSWQTYFLDLNDLIEPEPGAIYRIEVGMQQAYSLYGCEQEIAEEDNELVALWDEDFDVYDDYYDDWYYDDYYWYDYNYQDRNNPCTSSYYRYHRAVSRNIIASDMSIIAKKGGKGELFTAISNFVSAMPMSNVQVEVLDYQLQPISAKRSNADGIAHWKDLRRAPFLIRASGDGEVAYLKMAGTSALDVSRFDVSGSALNNGRKGFIYGDRGVWRPGDTLNVSFMLEDQLEDIPNGHPVVLQFKNPQGVLKQKQTQSYTKNGINSFHIATDLNDLTGYWNLSIQVGNSTFSQNMRVETVKPNRLKIELEAENDKILASESGELNLSARWLHGWSGMHLNPLQGWFKLTSVQRFLRKEATLV